MLGIPVLQPEFVPAGRGHVIDRMVRRTPFYYGWVVLSAAASSLFVRNAAASLTLAVFIYPISQDLNWSRTLIAGAASFGGLAASVASPFVGWACDKYGVRVVLTLSILMLGLSTVSLAWATVPVVFYLAYGIGRVIFSSSVQIGSSVAVSRWFVRRRGRATGILFLSHSVGMVVFPLLAGFIIRARDWQEAWIFLGVLVWIGALAPVSFLIRQSPEAVGIPLEGDEEGHSQDDAQALSVPDDLSWTLREAMRTPTLWLLSGATGFLFLLQSGTNIHQAAYFVDQGLGVSISALSISFNAVFTGAGSLFWGWVVERVPVRFTYAGVALVMALALVLFSSADTVREALLAASLFGISVGGILVVPAVAYADYYGRQSIGTIRGVTEPLVSLGQAVGAVFSGAVFDITGSYHDAFVILAAIGVVTIVVLLLIKPPNRMGMNDTVAI